MPVYRQSRFVHIHIPKTGGTAIEQFFHARGDMAWGPESWVGQSRVRGRYYELQHLSMPELLFLSHAVFLGLESFAVVRNPYSRLVSEFLWRSAPSEPGHEPLQRFRDFAAFISAIPTVADHRWPFLLRHQSQRHVNFLIHVRPQHHYVCGPDGQPMVDDILRFESLGPEFARLVARRGLNPTTVHTPVARNALAYYNRPLVDRVNQIYAEDFRLGRYPMM